MMRLPWHGKCAPHTILDILRGCNCRCRHCFNADAAVHSKSLEELRRELALVRSARNVTTVSLSGGEPLLHPEIERIVSWLHDEEHLIVCTLTNGIRFDEKMAEKLRAAGCGMVTLHIQSGQRRPELETMTVAELRREKGRIARKHGLYPAVICTIDGDDAEEFRDLAGFLRTAPEYEYALVTVAREFQQIDGKVPDHDVRRDAMLEAFAQQGYRPSCYVGGKYFRDVPRWYVFQSAQAVDAEGRERDWNITRPGLLERTFLYGLAFFCRRSIHWTHTSSAKLKARLLLNGLLGGHCSTSWFALKAILRGWKLLEKHIVVQLPPYSLGDGRVELCDNCPDVSVHEGRLRPLCLADVDVEVQI